MLTIVSPYVHSGDEHALIHLLSASARQRAIRIQTKLAEIFGDTIWLQQPRSLHMTLMEIINDTEYKDVSRLQYFKQWHQNYNQRAKDVIAHTTPFDVTLTELIVSQRAVILKAKDSTPFNNLRAHILAKTKLPPYTKQPPDITHCTLARFTRAIDLDQAVSATKHISVSIIEHIEAFSLVKDLGPPDFSSTPQDTYVLQGEE